MRWKVHEIAVEIVDIVEIVEIVDSRQRNTIQWVQKKRKTTVKVNSSEACDKTLQFKQQSTVVCIKEEKNNQKI